MKNLDLDAGTVDGVPSAFANEVRKFTEKAVAFLETFGYNDAIGDPLPLEVLLGLFACKCVSEERERVKPQRKEALKRDSQRRQQSRG